DDHVSPVLGWIQLRRFVGRFSRLLRGFCGFDRKQILAVLMRGFAFYLWSGNGFTVGQIESRHVALDVFCLRKLAKEITVVTQIAALKITHVKGRFPFTKVPNSTA